MTDSPSPIWIDPTDSQYPETPGREAPTNPYLSHQVTWTETTGFKPKMHPVGRLRYYYKWPGHGGRLWPRTRYWPTRRRVLDVRGEYNPKTMRREKTIADKRPIWWALALVACLCMPLFVPGSLWNTAMSAV